MVESRSKQSGPGQEPCSPYLPGGLLLQRQQAAEKAIKAVMVLRGIEFPYIHDLTRLMSMLEASGETIPDPVRRAAVLTRFAAQTRYPSVEEPVTKQEYTEAIAIAEAVLHWAEDRIQ